MTTRVKALEVKQVDILVRSDEAGRGVQVCRCDPKRDAEGLEIEQMCYDNHGRGFLTWEL